MNISKYNDMLGFHSSSPNNLNQNLLIKYFKAKCVWNKIMHKRGLKTVSRSVIKTNK